MTIPIGTLCYITGNHACAGQCCTVISGLEQNWVMEGYTPIFASYYKIQLSDGTTRYHHGYGEGELVAFPSDLIPIAPPGLVTEEDKRIPVEAA